MTKLSSIAMSLLESKRLVLLEEPHDHWKAYKAGTISYQEYLEMVRQYERAQGGGRSRQPSRPAPRKRKVRRSKGGFVYGDVRQDADSEIAAMVDPLEAILNDPGARISQWEREFLQSVIDQLDYGKKTELSPKQGAIVKRILAKAGPGTAGGSDADGDGRSDAEELIDIAKNIEGEEMRENRTRSLFELLRESASLSRNARRTEDNYRVARSLMQQAKSDAESQNKFTRAMAAKADAGNNFATNASEDYYTGIALDQFNRGEMDIQDILNRLSDDIAHVTRDIDDGNFV
jgi:hypothetical protein